VRLPRLPAEEELPYTDPRAILGPSGNPNLRMDSSAEPLPLPPTTTEPPAEVVRGTPLLTLDEVLLSVERDYPLLAAAFAERGIAAGELLAAGGPFNTKFTSYGKTYPLGGYRYTVSDNYFEQPGWWGGEAYAGYRIGVGPTFPIWYGELATNSGGEFRAGHVQPFLKNLAIDKRRAELFKARLNRSAAEPEIRKQRIEFLQAAATAYWSWVAAGRRYVIAQQILSDAVLRDKILAARERLEDIAPIDRVDNQRIVLDRRAKLIFAGRRLQETAIKLSLFFRDLDGQPILPEPNRLPHTFPRVLPPQVQLLSADVQLAWRQRPELRELALRRQATVVQLNLARNQRLPQVDGILGVAQDVGQEKPGFFKTPFQLESGVYGSVPIQRSEARGQALAAQSLLAQIGARTRWTQDKIRADVQDAMSALIASHDTIAPISESVQLTYRMEVAERERYSRGDSNLFTVNLRELQTAEAAILEVDALSSYFIEQADYLAALGLDGLSRRQFARLGTP
jgi:outer membrane protein TolC